MKPLAFFLTLAIGFFIYLFKQLPPRRPDPQKGFPEAYELATRNFSLQLKAPATAIYPRWNEAFFNRKDGKLYIVSHVDAQNSYGALIRTKWSAVVHQEGNKWVLESVESF